MCLQVYNKAGNQTRDFKIYAKSSIYSRTLYILKIMWEIHYAISRHNIRQKKRCVSAAIYLVSGNMVQNVRVGRSDFFFF